MKLIEIMFQNAPRLPGVPARDLTAIKIANPPGAMVGWRVALRGASVFFISPPGWKPSSGMPDTKECTIHEVPRLNCFLHWSGVPEDITNVAKYDATLGPEPETKLTTKEAAGGLLAQVPGIL